MERDPRTGFQFGDPSLKPVDTTERLAVRFHQARVDVLGDGWREASDDGFEFGDFHAGEPNGKSRTATASSARAHEIQRAAFSAMQLAW